MTVYPFTGKKGKAWSVSSLMGWRIHPVTKKRAFHNGTDIVAPANSPIHAFHNGVVIAVGYNPTGFGNSITLRHNIDGKMYTSLYAHMKDKSTKRVGDRVKAGDAIGIIGTTGMSTGVHLHWEVQVGRFHVWSALGLGFVEPIAFTEKLMAKEK
jgi:murein DD-endopeptidase MepM/ murein hydrolase activator NlpD